MSASPLMLRGSWQNSFPHTCQDLLKVTDPGSSFCAVQRRRPLPSEGCCQQTPAQSTGGLDAETDSSSSPLTQLTSPAGLGKALLRCCRSDLFSAIWSQCEEPFVQVVSKYSRVMSFRKSSSRGEGLPSSRYGERTPLRSLGNEVLHFSTPSSRIKSKSQLDAVKRTLADIPLSDPESQLHSTPSTKEIQTDLPSVDMTPTQTACALGDVTFKSFICAGGEVDISVSSLCAEESIILPKDQAACNNDTEDTVISDSMIAQSCCDHIEHPYHNTGMKEPYSDDTGVACLGEIPNTTLASGDLDDKQATEDSRAFLNDCSKEKHVTWKSFVCDGGEVEVADVTILQDETILLPKSELGEPLQDDSVNSSNYPDDSDQLCQAEHTDHPYCGNENDIVTVVTTLSGSGNPATGLSDVTFKSFNCTGSEIETSEGTSFADESVLLPTNHTVASRESYNYSMNPSMLAHDHHLQNGNDRLDHMYCNIQNYSSPPHGNLSTTQEPMPCSTDAEEVKQLSLVGPDSPAGRQEGVTLSSLITESEDGKSDDTQLFGRTSPLPEDNVVLCQPLEDNSVATCITQDLIQEDAQQPNSCLENDAAVVDTDPAGSSESLKTSDNQTVTRQVQEISKCTMHPEDSALPSVVHRTEISDHSHPTASAESLTPVEVQQHLQHVFQVYSSRGPTESSEKEDGTLGSSGNGTLPSTSAEEPPAENHPDIFDVLSECPSFASALQLGILSPVLSSASMSLLKAQGDPGQDLSFAENSAFEGEKSFLAALNTGLRLENLESPIPRPLFSSTAFGYKPQPDPITELVEDLGKKLSAVPLSEVEKPVLNIPLIPNGPLQQQLRQMAEFLILASGKMGPAAVAASVQLPASHMAPPAKTTPAESHSVCVGTSPVKMVDHSLNTSGLFERKRDLTVVDSCTLTDPLLWNLPPGSLECFPRQELEQRLRSSMIMVEALVQQLTAARAQGCPSAGAAPSDLREKLVQTDHTELSQTTMYRDLYLEALSRIGELEHDGSSLQTLKQCMQDMRVTMSTLSSDTDAALSNMKELDDIVKEDHQGLVSHYGHMRSLLEKSKETQTRMEQKVKDALHQRNDMRTRMEETLTAKEAAFSAMEQLRTHCATHISALEKSVGSQQELLASLKHTYPEQVALNEAYTESLNLTSDLLSQTMDEQSSLMKELCTVRSLLQNTAPMLLQLNEKAAAALRERDEHFSARGQAIEEREQIEEELNEAYLNLQTAREQIGDLNLQVTIMTSEMGVLRQKLTEKEEEKGQLERKVTDLSATVSSTLASYTFLEQALAAQTTKLQQSWKDIKEAKDRANESETSLGQSEQRVCDLSQALAQSEEQLGQLQRLSQSQSLQIQQLQDVCTQLSGVRETNEFLQMENELTREQVAESECTLRENLQGLRERNIQCEDLKAEICQLQLKNRSLQEELEAARSRARTAQLERGEEMGQAVTEITLLHHTLRGLTNELHAALSDQKPEPQKDKETEPVYNMERRHNTSSFVDSIMVALTAEKEEDVKTSTPATQCETLFSETSAFTRIVPKNPLNPVDFEPEEEEQSCVAELLADLGNTVAELGSTLKSVQQCKDSRLEELHNTICGLQAKQLSANSRHEAEVFEFQHQLSRLNNLMERGNQALQQKVQDEKTVTRLMVELQVAQEIHKKLETDNYELRKDVTELRCALQQSKVESQFLREELRKAGSQSANPAHFMEEKIQLLREVERLKASLQEGEQARVKLLERAKRHQMIHQSNQQKSEKELQILNNVINKVREMLLSLPDVVKNCEQLEKLVEYIG
ncbi:sperm-associated antigen 5 isoform X1 [Brachyistius frenatus]|uniref:sperm-associated antigen 5 isoform X1 n=2 Tax=Brachyistius frenatus TaxID=100188 RepID=UPI0037E8C1F6